MITIILFLPASIASRMENAEITDGGQMFVGIIRWWIILKNRRFYRAAVFYH